MIYNRTSGREFDALIFVAFIFMPLLSSSQSLEIERDEKQFSVSIRSENGEKIHAPAEGLWSIATDWKENWPAGWHHAAPTRMEEFGAWKILSGTIILPEGTWRLQDAYKEDNGRIKWHGEETLDQVTLSVRWQVENDAVQAFLPGILYYGNPSGEKNGAHKVPVFHGKPGEAAIFEEHRFPMPFACLEWKNANDNVGAALHALPSLVHGGNLEDQWWSLGVQTLENHSELIMLSGPITYNNEKSVAKALQRSSMPYGDTYMNIKPGMVIEKTFYLEVYETNTKG